MSLRIITPPASEPVTLDEAKAFLGVTSTDKDDVISALLSTATLQAQAEVQRAFVTQTQEWVVSDWCYVMRLPLAPVVPTGLVSIKYFDLTDVQQTLSPSLYVVSQSGKTISIRPKLGVIWPYVSITPAAEPIVIRFTVGEAVDAVPQNVKTAIKFAVRNLYNMNANLFVSVDKIEGIGERRFIVSKDTADTIDGLVCNLLADQRWE
jgi:uncharacterized phiE125 gp8 family phage protein